LHPARSNVCYVLVEDRSVDCVGVHRFKALLFELRIGESFVVCYRVIVDGNTSHVPVGLTGQISRSTAFLEHVVADFVGIFATQPVSVNASSLSELTVLAVNLNAFLVG